MAEEPGPPPEEQDDGESLEPFVDVGTGGGLNISVRAGWARSESGEIDSLVVNYNGGAQSPTAEKACEAAIEWYRDVVAAIAQQAQSEGQDG